MNSAAVEYNNLQVEISTRRSLLDELVRKQSETDVSSRLQATGESNVRIVDRALVPGGPPWPSLQRSLTMGIGAGCSPIGLVFLLHYMDRGRSRAPTRSNASWLPVLLSSGRLRRRAGGGLGRYEDVGSGTATALAARGDEHRPVHDLCRQQGAKAGALGAVIHSDVAIEPPAASPAAPRGGRGVPLAVARRSCSPRRRSSR
ncbi:MAG: hypothetical protein R2862_02875 [Thermoanaerobaculia bacterium]